MSINDIGNRIAILRKQKNLTQKQLAKELNISSQLISKWENNQAIPSLEYTIQLSNFFGVKIDDFVNGYEESQTINKTKTTKNLKDCKFVKIATSKPAILTYIAAVCVAFLIVFICLTIFTFIPAANKDNYIQHINESVQNRVHSDDFFNLEIITKQNGNITKTEYYKGYINDKGLTYESSEEINFKIVDNIEYYYSYKTPHKTDLTTTHQLLRKTLSSISETEYNFDKKDITYLKKIKEGYYIRVSKNLVANEMSEDALHNISFNGDFEGKIYIIDNLFIKMELSLKYRTKQDNKNHVTTSILELKQDKPIIIKPNQNLPWEITDCNVVDNYDFLSTLYPNTEVKNIKTLSSDHKNILYEGLINNNYIVNDNKIYIIHIQNSRVFSINIFNLNTLEYIDSIDLINYELYKYIPFEDCLIFYTSTSIYRVNLNNLSISEIFLNKNASNISLEHIYNNYIAFYVVYPYNINNKDYFVFYNVESNTYKTFIYDGLGQTYIKDNYIYTVNDGEYYSYSDTIYKFDITNCTKQEVASSLYINKICYINDKNEIFYYIDYSESSVYGIKKIGSDFLYKYGTTLKMIGDDIYIYDDEYTYIYQNEALMQTIYNDPTESKEDIYQNEDIIYIDDYDNIYILGDSKVYNSNYENYTSITELYWNHSSKTPKITSVIENYIIVEYSNYLKDEMYLTCYEISDLSKPIIVTNVSTKNKSSYYQTKIDNNLIWKINNDFYIITPKQT